MKKLLFLALALIVFQTNFAQNIIDINGIPQNQFPEKTAVNDPEGAFKASKRFREFSVNQQVQSDRQVRLNDVLLLDLFKDRQYQAKVEKMGYDINGTFSITARLSDFEYAWCFISTSGGKTLITIEIPGQEELFVTRYNPKTNKYHLLEIDRKKREVLEGAPSLVPPEVNNRNSGESGFLEGNASISVNDVNTPDVVSVLIVYTPSAASWAAGSEGGINNTINSIMQKANLALGNSNTLLQFELVHSAQVDYTELNTSQDLYNLTGTTDGYMDNVHTLRNTYGADVVVLLENISFTGGIAWLLNSTAGSPSYAFSITRVQQASGTYTTVHEIGHNMGCGHHKAQNYQPGPGIFSYSAGWRWIGTNNGKYCSVMTYESGTYFADGITHTRVPYFSNPSILYQGVATGDAADGDNARTLRETKGVVAAYRTAPCVTPTQQATLFSASDITASSLTVGWNRGNGTNVLVVARQGSAVNANPVNGTAYTANSAFGNGTQIGTGNYVVYNGTGNAVTVTGLLSGTTYYFAIYEYNIASNCYLTTALTGNETTSYSIPAAPVAKAASGTTQTGFQANWNAAAGATGYFLDVSKSSTFEFTEAILSNQSVGNVLLYQVSGLTAGTPYYYRVRATNSAGTSGHSNVISVTTLQPAAPSAPVAVSASGTTNSGFNANWNASAGATGYYLDVSVSSKFTSFVSGYNNLDVGNTITYAVSGLKSNTSYYYRLRAYNSGGISASSNRITVKTASGLTAPEAQAASDISAGSFTANWNAVTGATGYYLDVATASNFKVYLKNYKNINVGDVTSVTVTGLSGGKTYYYRVRAYNGTETSANSNVISVTTPASLKSGTIVTAEPAGSTMIFVCFPNPFRGQTTISYDLPDENKTTIGIYDITGRLVNILINEVQQSGSYQVVWDATGQDNKTLNAGIYIAKIRSGNFSKSLKLVYQGK